MLYCGMTIPAYMQAWLIGLAQRLVLHFKNAIKKLYYCNSTLQNVKNISMLYCGITMPAYMPWLIRRSGEHSQQDKWEGTEAGITNIMRTGR